MARTTITLPTELLDDLKNMLGTSSKTEAVIVAIKDEISAKKIENIKKMAGKLEFIKTAEELRHGDHRLG
ncbi:DUF2191 domain-containing protein [bacterium]|nr:DUF2191 domain-containing protein [bacterium]